MFTLAGVDDTSGVAGTEVRIDGGDWVAYGEPVTVTGTGAHMVEYRSTDVAGNAEEAQTAGAHRAFLT